MNAGTEDDTRTPLALSLAVALHVLVAAVLLVYFWQARAPMMSASEHVFELVTSPSPNPDNAAASSGAPAQAIHAPTLPKITPMPPLPPVSKSQPTPPKPVTPPTPDAAPKAETIDQFRQKFAQQQTSSTPTHATTSRTIPVVGISDAQIKNNLNKFGSSTSNPTDTAHSGQPSSGVTNDYVAGLVARLQAAYENPPELVDPGLAAGVEITIAADGRVISQRLVRSSGNAVFDAAVQAALERVTMVDPPPSGEQTTFTFTFKNVAQ
jgi:TonB family protein